MAWQRVCKTSQDYDLSLIDKRETISGHLLADSSTDMLCVVSISVIGFPAFFTDFYLQNEYFVKMSVVL